MPKVLVLFCALSLGIFFSQQSKAFYQERFVVSPGVQTSVHSSAILEYMPGSFLSCWYGGSREGHKDVQIFCSHLDAGSAEWSKPRVAVSRQERAEGVILRNGTVGNPVVFNGVNGEIWLVYAARPFGGWVLTHVDYKLSKDGGHSWSKSRRLVYKYGHLPRIKPLQIDPQHILLPLYDELPKRGYSALIEINPGKIKIVERRFIPKTKHLQPSFVELNGQIWAFLRNGKTKKVLSSMFDENQHTWSTPAEVADLQNPNSSVDTVSRTENQMLIAYNSDSSSRTPISLASSFDGVKFKHLFDFEQPNDGGEYSYPAFIKDQSGLYHLTYTYLRKGIKHVTFDEAWLSEKLR